MSLKKIHNLPDIETLRMVFDYCTIAGNLIWKPISPSKAKYLGWSSKRYKQHNTRYSGKVAGHEFVQTHGKRNRQVRFDGVSYYCHRIIYKWVTGIDALIIDHDNGDQLDNRFRNLKNVTNAQNAKNCKLHTKNTSGHTGVSWSKQHYKWEAYIWKDSKKYNLGIYSELEDAIKVRKEKEIEFGYHKNHGKRMK